MRSAVTHSQTPFSTSALGFSKEKIFWNQYCYHFTKLQYCVLKMSHTSTSGFTCWRKQLCCENAGDLKLVAGTQRVQASPTVTFPPGKPGDHGNTTGGMPVVFGAPEEQCDGKQTKFPNLQMESSRNCCRRSWETLASQVILAPSQALILFFPVQPSLVSWRCLACEFRFQKLAGRLVGGRSLLSGKAPSCGPLDPAPHRVVLKPRFLLFGSYLIHLYRRPEF